MLFDGLARQIKNRGGQPCSQEPSIRYIGLTKGLNSPNKQIRPAPFFYRVCGQKGGDIIALQSAPHVLPYKNLINRVPGCLRSCCSDLFDILRVLP